MYFKPDGYQERKQNNWYVTILIVLIPLFIFSASVNMVTRVGDGYEWRFNKNAEIKAEDEKAAVKTLQELEIYIDEATLAGNIADYINGKSDKVLTYAPMDELADYYKARAPKMTQNDYDALHALKILDGILLAFAALSFLWSAYMSFRLIRGGYETKEILRNKLLKSFLVLGAFEAVMLIYTGVKPVFHFVNGKMLGLSYGENDFLMNLLGSGFPLSMALFILGVSLIVSAVIFYIIWVCTKPRDIFNERRYFR